jgi:hypothetical protein
MRPGRLANRNPINVGLLMGELHRLSDFDYVNDNDAEGTPQ